MASGRFRFQAWCELVDQAGAWRDVTDWLGTNWLNSATWTENADQPVSTGSVVLKREDRGISLAPGIGGSPANHVGAAYVPFLREGGGVRLSIAITPTGTLPTPADRFEVFIGTYDGVKVSSTDPTITLDMRDKGAYVVDTFTRTKKTYAAIDDTTGEGGAPLETVVQQMLDDNLGAGVVTLAVPVSPGVMVSNVEVDRKSLMEAVRDVALMIGWDIRYRYDGAGVSRLTLTKPARTSAPGNEQVWFAANEYVAVPRLDVSVVDTRQAVRVDFLNADTGEPDFVEEQDDAAIAIYGPPRGPIRWAQLGFAATSTINTTDEALTLAKAAVSDLAFPFSDHDLELFPCWWPAQIGDYIGARANTSVYDTDQSFGVFGFTHTVDNASSSTTLVTKGRVVGAFKEWLRRSDSDKGVGEGGTPDTRVLALKNFREIRRTPTKVTYGWNTCDPDVAAIWVWGKLSPQDVDPPLPPDAEEDRLWRNTETEVFDLELDRDATTFDVTVPDFGNVQTWELVPVSAAHERGYPQRVKVLSVPDIPRIPSIETEEGSTGLFTDILKLNIVDPQALGGTLSAWLNHDISEDALGDGTPDGTLAIAVTPYTVTPADSFAVPGGTSQLFDNVRIHAGAGKRVTFEFVNSRGTSSGKISFVLLGNGGVILPDGTLKDDSINRAQQIANAFSLPSVYDSLPTTGRPNEMAVWRLATPYPKLYRWTGTAWTAQTPTSDLTGKIQIGQLDANTVTANELAADAVYAAAIQAGAVTATAIHTGSVDASKLTTIVLAESRPNAGIIQIGKLLSVDGQRFLDLAATGANEFLKHPAFSLFGNGNATFSGTVSGVAGTFGTITGGKFQSADTLRWLWLDATGANEFIKHPALTVRADGTATFSGAVASSSFTTVNAAFAGEVSLRSTVSIYSNGYGADVAGGIRWYNNSSVLRARTYLYAAAADSNYDSLTVWGYNSMIITTDTGAITIDPPQLVLLAARTVVHATDGATATPTIIEAKWTNVANPSGIVCFTADFPSGATGDCGMSVLHHKDDGTYALKRVTCAGTDSQGGGWRGLRIAN